MGQGGTLNLVNGTPYTWTQTYVHSYQMNAWSFPATLAPGQVAAVYVEWDQHVTHDQADDAGEVTFALAGTSRPLFPRSSAALA